MTASAVGQAPPTEITERNITNLANQPASGGMPASERKKSATSPASPGAYG